MLEDLKAEVLRVARLAETNCLCKHGGGNFSMIDREKGLVAVTPSAVSRYCIDDDAIILLDLDGNIVENLKNLKPTSESIIHLEVLKARPEINAVCHTHARAASTFAVMNRPIKPVIFESFMYGGYCRVSPFQTPGTIELARSVVKGLEGTLAVLLQRHGLLTIGKDIYDAYIKSVYVEEVAEISLRAASIIGYDALEAFSDEDIHHYLVELGLTA